MLYRDLKPGDIMIYAGCCWLVVGIRKSSTDSVTIHYVNCWDGQIMIRDNRNSTQLPSSCEVIRDALQGSETG
jgi:hypothetical protein